MRQSLQVLVGFGTRLMHKKPAQHQKWRAIVSIPAEFGPRRSHFGQSCFLVTPEGYGTQDEPARQARVACEFARIVSNFLYTKGMNR